MKLEILTPDKKIFEGDIEAIKVPGSEGSFEALNNHAPIISTLEKGKIRIRTTEETKFIEIDGGVMEVNKNKIIVLSETAKE
ncbi:MAG: ATP synthase F1 subunit epsilon [Bacteroidetes bacterium RIFCSPLOWO2_02_FULL_36_8]|nr:MAG: ATP synthase F1 subunit epsilon [Bacteroidetes bacterium RIFCSPLOWO2_02_FULL_36_8]OFY69840.1 MAG: ATP synthase F1 subunit epsilon [Bacteroidetes bacterium RIFCSPLOWO2_12_FULL_37_12]